MTSSEAPQPDHQDLNPPQLPSPPTQNHQTVTTTSTSSSSEDPQLDHKDPQPDHKDPQPDHKDSQPDHKDPQPDHKDSQPDHKDPQLDHKDPQPDHKDPQPEHKDPQPDHKDPQPDHKDPQPDHKDPQPDHKDPQPDHKDPQPDHKDPQPDHKDPDAPEPPDPPTCSHAMVSPTSSSSSTEAPHQDPDASAPPVAEREPSKAEVKPVPRPRSKIKKKAEGRNSSGSDCSDRTDSPTTEEGPADVRRPHPARPPPRPPMSKVLMSGSKAAPHVDAGSQCVGSNPEAAVKPHRPHSAPPRPERPPPPSFYYGGAPAAHPKSCTDELQQSTCSPSGSRPAAVCDAVLNLDGSYGETTKDNKDKPAVPPRPKQSLLPSYASHGEATSPQVRPAAPPPPAETLNEPLYTDINTDERPYLEILPNKEDKMIKPPPPPPALTSERRSWSVQSEKDHRPPLSENEDKMKQRRSLPRSAPSVQSERYVVRPQSTEDSEEICGMLRWLKKVSKPDYMTPSVYGLSIDEEVRSFNQRAANVSKALRLYHLLMMKRGDGLKSVIGELGSISDSLDRMQQMKKAVGIAGGTTGAVGGVTAVVGIALAPMTLGASLIATAVGAGMVASAGGIGAHTAKASKKIVSRASVEKLVDEYMANVADVERCLDFILCGMNELRRHDVARLNRAGTQSEGVRMAHLAQSVFSAAVANNNNNMGPHARGTSSEKLLQAFSKEVEQYFTEDGHKLKKLNKSKFSGRVQLLAENLSDELEYLNHMWEVFT